MKNEEENKQRGEGQERGDGKRGGGKVGRGWRGREADLEIYLFGFSFQWNGGIRDMSLMPSNEIVEQKIYL